MVTQGCKVIGFELPEAIANASKVRRLLYGLVKLFPTMELTTESKAVLDSLPDLPALFNEFEAKGLDFLAKRVEGI
jgi:hypothetical protein